MKKKILLASLVSITLLAPIGVLGQDSVVNYVESIESETQSINLIESETSLIENENNSKIESILEETESFFEEEELIESEVESILENNDEDEIESEPTIVESGIELVGSEEDASTGNLVISKKLLSNVWHVGCDVMGDQTWVKDEINNPEGIPSKDGHRKNKCGDPTHWNIYINTDGVPYMLQEIKSGATNGTLNTCFYTDNTYTKIRDISDIKIGERVYWTTWNFDKSLGVVGVWHHTGVTYPEIPEFEFEFNGQTYFLKPNESLTLTDIPAGTYTITEKYKQDYIIGDVSIPYVQEADGDIVVEVTILPEQIIEVDFTNTRGNLPEPTPIPSEPPVESEPEPVISEVESTISEVESIPESTVSEVESIPESIISEVESVPESTVSEIESTISEIESTVSEVESTPESTTSEVESTPEENTNNELQNTPIPTEEPVPTKITIPSVVETSESSTFLSNLNDDKKEDEEILKIITPKIENIFKPTIKIKNISKTNIKEIIPQTIEPTESIKPTNTIEENAKVQPVQTGDKNNIIPFLILLIGSLSFIIICFMEKNDKYNKH